MKDFGQKGDPKLDVKVLLKWQSPRWESFSFLNRSGENIVEFVQGLHNCCENPASDIQKQSCEIQYVWKNWSSSGLPASFQSSYCTPRARVTRPAERGGWGRRDALGKQARSELGQRQRASGRRRKGLRRRQRGLRVRDRWGRRGQRHVAGARDTAARCRHRGAAHVGMLGQPQPAPWPYQSAAKPAAGTEAAMGTPQMRQSPSPPLIVREQKHGWEREQRPAVHASAVAHCRLATVQIRTTPQECGDEHHRIR
eukprot:gene17475-biopygen3380